VTRKLSIIVPVYNEGPAVATACDAIRQMCETRLADWDPEIIFVDDGSRDDSFAHIKKLCREHSNVKGIRFAVNAGSHMAIRAGLEHATGDAACFLACDLQDPPEVVPSLVAELDNDADVVWAVRSRRQDAWKTRVFSHIYQRVARMLVSKNIPLGGSSMILMGAAPLKMLARLKERNVALEGILATAGFRHAYVSYQRQARRTGKSKWTLAKKINLFADSILSLSYKPIRLISLLGFLMAAAGVGLALSAVAARLSGWLTSGMGLVLFASALLVGQGCTIFGLGIVGEYVWRALDESRDRPKYIVDEMVQIAGDAVEDYPRIFARRAA
jgi:dolichol-phosphate mannosyltransferase